MGLHFYTLHWTLESEKLRNKNVCLSITGLTQQVWVVQTLPVSKKGLAFDWFLGANSKPREYPSQSECFYLLGALGPPESIYSVSYGGAQAMR